MISCHAAYRAGYFGSQDFGSYHHPHDAVIGYCVPNGAAVGSEQLSLC